jgi:hypothetical protein
VRLPSSRLTNRWGLDCHGPSAVVVAHMAVVNEVRGQWLHRLPRQTTRTIQAQWVMLLLLYGYKKMGAGIHRNGAKGWPPLLVGLPGVARARGAAKAGQLQLLAGPHLCPVPPPS